MDDEEDWQRHPAWLSEARLKRLRAWNGKYGIVFRDYIGPNGDVWASMDAPGGVTERMTPEELALWHLDFPPDD